MRSRSLQFAGLARLITEVAENAGVAVPTFRSPPRIVGRDRTLRRRDDGTAAVAVRVAGRPLVAIAADLIDGVVVGAGLLDTEAEQCRRVLWEAVASSEYLSGMPSATVEELKPTEGVVRSFQRDRPSTAA